MVIELAPLFEDARCTLSSCWLMCIGDLWSCARRVLPCLLSQRTWWMVSPAEMVKLQLRVKARPTSVVRLAVVITLPETNTWIYLAKGSAYFYKESKAADWCWTYPRSWTQPKRRCREADTDVQQIHTLQCTGLLQSTGLLTGNKQLQKKTMKI